MYSTIRGDADPITHRLHPAKSPAAAASRLIANVRNVRALRPGGSSVEGCRHLEVFHLIVGLEVRLSLLGLRKSTHESFDVAYMCAYVCVYVNLSSQKRCVNGTL